MNVWSGFSASLGGRGGKKSSPTYLFSVGTEILINSVSAVLFIITPDSDEGEMGKSQIFYTMV